MVHQVALGHLVLVVLEYLLVLGVVVLETMVEQLGKLAMVVVLVPMDFLLVVMVLLLVLILLMKVV